jgi:hypothetical protein
MLSVVMLNVTCKPYHAECRGTIFTGYTPSTFGNDMTFSITITNCKMQHNGYSTLSVIMLCVVGVPLVVPKIKLTIRYHWLLQWNNILLNM